MKNSHTKHKTQTGKESKDYNPPAKRMADMEKIAAKRTRQMKRNMK